MMLAWTLLRIAPAVIPHGTVPVGLALTLDTRVLAFALVTTLFTGLIFGLAPVWQLARRSVAAGLQGGGSYTVVSGNTRLLGGIAALQIAVGVTPLDSSPRRGTRRGNPGELGHSDPDPGSRIRRAFVRGRSEGDVARSVHSLSPYGSKRSRRPWPTSVKPTTVTAIARPGKTSAHQACVSTW